MPERFATLELYWIMPQVVRQSVVLDEFGRLPADELMRCMQALHACRVDAESVHFKLIPAPNTDE